MKYKIGEKIDYRSTDTLFRGKNGHFMKKLIIQNYYPDVNCYRISSYIEDHWSRSVIVKEEDIRPLNYKFYFPLGSRVRVIKSPVEAHNGLEGIVKNTILTKGIETYWIQFVGYSLVYLTKEMLQLNNPFEGLKGSPIDQPFI